MGSKNVRTLDTEKSLNIKEHRKELIKLALERYNTKKEAAEALGITVRHLSNLEPTIDLEASNTKEK